MTGQHTRPRLHSLLVVTACLALGGCLGSRTDGPAPVFVHGQTGRDPAAGGPAGLGGMPPAVVTVQPGDTVHAIARRHRVPVKALILANGLQPPYHIRVSQTLIIPVQRTHTVGRGETLYSLGRRYQVEVPAIVRANKLGPPYKLLVGQVMVIPDAVGPRGGAGVAQAQAPWRDQDRNPPATTMATMATTTTARTGGTGGRAGSDDIAVVPLDPPRFPAASPGDSGDESVASRPLAKAQGTAVVATTTGGPATAAPATAPSSAPATAPSSAPSAAPATARPPVVMAAASVPKPPPRSGSLFRWPVSGRVIAGYGPFGEGLHNDGVNIAAPRGTPIRAADNGVVVYGGNELKGFGNLLLIKHADGWMTAYAHAERLLVKRGDKVNRGQIIATVGATGSVTAPQLHFEVRQGTKAIDPAPYMERTKAVNAGLDGHRTQGAPVPLSPPGAQPSVQVSRRPS